MYYKTHGTLKDVKERARHVHITDLLIDTRSVEDMFNIRLVQRAMILGSPEQTLKVCR